MNKPFLLEIGTEELPAAYLAPYCDQLLRLLTEEFKKASLDAKGIETHSTPRRLVFFCKSLADRQPVKEEDVKGPPAAIAFQNGAPTRAATAFAGKCGLPLEQIQTRSFDGKDYLFARVTRGGGQTVDLLEALIPAVIRQLRSPKSMRWEDKPTLFARPIRWIAALYDKAVIPAELDGLVAGNITYGQRFLSPKPVKLQSARLGAFEKKLRKAHVILRHDERVAAITSQLLAHGAREDRIDRGLVNVCADLVEWPSVVRGSFPAAMLELPEPVLMTSLKKHQKSFLVYDEDGKVAPGFLAVANNDLADEARIRSGYERVVVARLADAKFFWDEDRERTLADRVEGLKSVVFQEKLGTYFEKTGRVQGLATFIADAAGKGEAAHDAARAAFLSRADLTTAMVFEFPELQGIMGRVYARAADSEPASVADAIEEMYQPRGADDALPKSLPGALLSVADKADTIAGCISIGFGPSGSGDPYALRRQALGLLRILCQHQLHLDLAALMRRALEPFAAHASAKTFDDILQLLRGRFETVLKDAGVRYDIVNAVLSSGWNDVAAAFDKARQLTALAATDAFRKACTVVERCHNITREADVPAGAVDTAAFVLPLETALWQQWQTVARSVRAAVEGNDIAAALATLAGSFHDTLHQYFDTVRVNEDDQALRANRQRVVRAIRDELVARIADLAQVVFEGEQAKPCER
ncbi:glycine--tRNA ligase subunit beta [bacterium]|nr:glycine--tRNA ligase subunit beta [bacterium]